MAERPTVSTEWAIGPSALKFNPTPQQKTWGWSTSNNLTTGVPEKPTLQHQNGWQYNVHLWKQYFETAIDEISSGLSLSTPKNYATSPNIYSPAATTNDLGWFTVGGTASTITTPPLPRNSMKSAIQYVSSITGDYLRWRFKIDDTDISKKLTLAFAQIATFGDFKLEVYSGTNAALDSPQLITIQSIYTNSSGITNLPTGTLDFLSSFDTTTRLYYEVRWTSLGSSRTLKINDVNISPDKTIQGSEGGQLFEETTTFAIGGSGSPAFGTSNLYRRTEKHQNYAIIRWEINQTAAGASGSGLYRLPFPAGLNVDLNAIRKTGIQSFTGYVGDGILVGGTSGAYQAAVKVVNGVTNAVEIDLMSDTVPPTAWSNTLASLGGNTSLVASFTARVPIAEWAGTGQISTINPVTQSPIRAGIIMPFAGATIPTGWLDCDGTAYPRAQYPQLFAQIGTTWDGTGSVATGAVNPLTGAAYAAPAATDFRVPDLRGVFLRGQGTFVDSIGSNTTLGRYQGDTTQQHSHPNSAGNSQTSTAISITGVIGADLSVVGSTSGANTGAMGQGNGRMATETRPRNQGVRYIIKAWDDSYNIAGGAEATATTLGFVSGGRVPGQNTGAPIAAGFIGEVRKSVISTNTSGTVSATYFDATSIVLPAGIWQVTSSVKFERNGVSFSVVNLAMGYNTALAPSGADLKDNVNSIGNTNAYLTTFTRIWMIGPICIIRSDGTNLTLEADGTVMSGTTLRLKMYMDTYASGTPLYTCCLQAVRIA